MLGLGPLIVDLEGDTALAPGDRDRLQHPLVGGVILFSRNYAGRAGLAALTREIKALRSPPLLVTVDQEGGRVQRFRDGFTRLPPASACGRLYESDGESGERLAYSVGLVMASELIRDGVDLSFAPVLDVLGCDSRVIGDRAFHSRPDPVSRLGSAYIAGMHDAGMRAIGKHFPGHGGVGADSHTCLPEDPRPVAALRACDLIPFSGLCGKLQGVMLAHVRYGRIDVAIPSYSGFWIREMLRMELGFQGTVFSDDLSMAGAGRAGLLERCSAALEAGCDLIPVCNDLAAVDRLLGDWKQPPVDAEAVIRPLYPGPGKPGTAELETARETVERAVRDSV